MATISIGWIGRTKASISAASSVTAPSDVASPHWQALPRASASIERKPPSSFTSTAAIAIVAPAGTLPPAAGYSTNCEQCHGTKSWFGASFSHQGITSGCFVCHQTEYNNTTNPDHMAAGFSTSCENCHNTNSWTNANWTHAFPINSGKHKNFNCSDCHLDPNNLMTFSCTHCHEHNQSEMDDKHSEVGGYVWSSPACYTCHPNGKE